MHAFGLVNKRKMKYTMLWNIIVSMLTCCYSVLAQEEVSIFLDDQGQIQCPSPLIVRGSIPANDAQICLNDCCLACPFANNFYQENKIESTYKIFAILGIISFFLMILLSIFFVFLPSQKQNPLTKRVLLPLALSVMYFEGSEFFIFDKKNQCSDAITPTDPSSNRYCTIQAIFTLGGAYAIACYSALLMLHLHLLSVWRTEFITKNILYFHGLIFGGSMAAVIIPFVTNNVKSMNICFISLNAAPQYFYFLSFIYIAFMAHLTTLVYMVHVSIKSNRRYSTVSTMSKRTSIIEAQRKLVYLKDIFIMQWRALLGAFLMLLIYVLNWNYYVYELQPLNGPLLTTTWIFDWIQCLKDHGDQNICARTIADNVPDYNYLVVLLFFNRAAGILIFLIFAVKKAVIFEVYNFIRGRKYRNSFSETQTRRSSGIRSTERSSVYRNRTSVSSATGSATLAETAPSSSRESTVSKVNEVKNTSVKFSDLPSIRKSTSTPSSLRNSMNSNPSVRNSRSLEFQGSRSSNSLRPISSVFNNNNHEDIPEIVVMEDDDIDIIYPDVYNNI